MLHARKDYMRFQDPAGLVPEDEPVILIRGQDRIAPAILATYEDYGRLYGYSDDVMVSIHDHRIRMVKWQNEHPNSVKKADLSPVEFDSGKAEWLCDEDGENYMALGAFTRSPENVYELAVEIASNHNEDLGEAFTQVLAGTWKVCPGADGGLGSDASVITVVEPDYS